MIVPAQYSEFGKNSVCERTASFIYTRSKGVFWFAFARKVSKGQRQRPGNTGAVGTDPRYWGQ